MPSVEEIVAARGIQEVVHFTSNHGFVGCLHTGAVISRRRLPAVDHLAYIAAPTAATRQEAEEYFDKEQDWLDYVNLSVSSINSSYFRFATKWHLNNDRWWLLLAFDPSILSHDGVYFATTNNVYPHVRRGTGGAGLELLFEDGVRRKGDWWAYRRGRSPWLPTCEQAEVLYPGTLLLSYLRTVYVRNPEEQDRVKGWLREFAMNEVRVVQGNEKFIGHPN